MIRCVVESPYAGDIERNIEYAKKCVTWCIKNAYAPICSHLLFTQPGILNDNDHFERVLGISCGLQWLRVSEKQIFFVDYGMSEGMNKGKEVGKLIGIEQEFIKIL